MSKSNNKDPDLQCFHLFLAREQRGEIADELNQAMQKCINEVTEACFERGGTNKATLTVQVTFKMDQKDKVMETHVDFDTKMPKKLRGRTGMYFVDGDGHLTRENPMQSSFADELAEHRAKNR